MYYDLKMEVFYVIILMKKEIKMINFNSFFEVKIFYIKLLVRGIIKLNGRFFMIGVELFCLFNYDFEVISEIDVDDDFDDIICDMFGNIIYLCY